VRTVAPCDFVLCQAASTFAAAHSTSSVLLQAHRLDEATGGLVLVGKSWGALRGLGEAFENRRIVKRYRLAKYFAEALPCLHLACSGFLLARGACCLRQCGALEQGLGGRLLGQRKLLGS
jgi:hypothetical protein